MWYYVSQGSSVGPVGAEAMAQLVREGRIQPFTRVWREGMADWQEARATELFRTPGTPPGLPSSPTVQPSVAVDDVTLSVLSHVLGLLTGFLGPLVIYLVATDPGAKTHARNALNWQISLMIYLLVCIPLAFVFIGILLMFALSIMNLVYCILAAIRAGNRSNYEYPMTLRLVT